MTTTTYDAIPDFCRKPVLIIGCGNILFGDDGFGCAVADYLQGHYETGDDACVADAGTASAGCYTRCASARSGPAAF